MANLTKQIKKQNPGSAHVKETDYYRWLGQDGNYNDNHMTSLIDYLGGFGFEVRKDTIDEPLLSRLKNIHHLYFVWEIANG